MENRIRYVKGDATEPHGSDNRIIVHICNDIGAWGAGFVLALSRKWKEPEEEYRRWFREEGKLVQGKIQLVRLEPNLFVANLIGQEGISFKGSVPPIRYASVEKGLNEVANEAERLNASIHMPRIGCGLAGGKWDEIERIINKTLIIKGISVTVYDLE